MSVGTAVQNDEADRVDALRPAGRRATIVPTRRMAIVVTAAAPVWLVSGTNAGAALAATVALGLFALILADVVAAPSPRALSVARQLPHSLGLGERSAAQYHVVSDWPREVHVALVASLPPALRRTTDEPTPVRVPAFGDVKISVPIETVARGRFRRGPMALLIDGRFGLTRRWVRYSDDATVVIAPSLRAARRFRLQALQARTTQSGERSLKRRGESLSFVGLRTYVAGDDPRLIDWKATARQRAPMVREFALEQGQTVLLAVDAGRMMTQLEDGRPRFEFALSAALVLAAVAADGGDRVGLLLFDDVIRAYVPPAKGMAVVNRIRDALVEAQPTLVEPDYAAAFATIASRQRRRSLIVVFTDVVDPRSSRALVMHSEAGMRRHLALVVALRNESLSRAASHHRAEGEGEGGKSHSASAVRDVYRSAAAEELLLARAETLQRMRRSGATVLDVAPTTMTAAVVNRYLELKARGAL